MFEVRTGDRIEGHFQAIGLEQIRAARAANAAVEAAQLVVNDVILGTSDEWTQALAQLSLAKAYAAGFAFPSRNKAAAVEVDG